MELSREQLVEFADRGYLVLREVVSDSFLDAAKAEIVRLIAENPPLMGHVGHHFYFRTLEELPKVASLFQDTAVSELARSLVAPGRISIAWRQSQVALNIPPYQHRPGGPHLDGYREGITEPETFTMLAAVLLTDQEHENSGNLWVWPGTHQTFAAYFREHGPSALLETKGHPTIQLPEPTQICGRRGDVLLAHYLLGHNIGGNYESSDTRHAVYWRIRRDDHWSRWQESIQDELLEYDAVREALSRTNENDISHARCK